MTKLDIAEVVPGLVARIDTAQLRAHGGSETNAQQTEAEDRAVTDTRDFLVVAIDATRGVCTAIPLFTKSSPGSAPLEPKKQWGNIDGWLTTTMHYSRWQHWHIPMAAFVAASGDDPGDSGARRSYAAGDADTLQDLANWATRNRCVFRPA